MIVLNFIILENIFETLKYLKKLNFKEVEIFQIMVAENKKNEIF